MAHIPDDCYEKRKIARQHMIVPLPCQLSRKDARGFGWVRDFSSTGAKVISSLRLMRGDELTLMFPTAGKPEMTISATVRWSEGPILGVEFKHTEFTKPRLS